MNKKIKLIDENLSKQMCLNPFLTIDLGWSRDIEDYDVCIYTDKLCYAYEIDETKENYAWILEPPIVNGENYFHMPRINNKFKYVFSYFKHLSNMIDNHIFVPHGGTWLREEDIAIHTKSKLVSFLFSDKNWNGFHKSRHQLYSLIKDNKDVSFYGSGCEKNIPFKIEALKDYYFSIIIENSVEDAYFTEKLIDCLLSGTIPIYLGTKQIGEYFNTDSMILFNDVSEIPDILSKLTPELYFSLIEGVKENFEKAKDYIHPEKIIQKWITE